MKRELFPSEDTKLRQRRAADPSASAWVSANAGSGKTYVLSNRVIRLLLSGVEPSRILCLTFTKAAAAHMSNTVFRRLSLWAAAPDDVLEKELRELGEAAHSPALRARARRLFARALDTPGGLKVLTIHAFCERLLHQFPFEARVPAAFTVLDDRQKAELVAEARDEVLTYAAADGDSALGRALSVLVAETSDGAMARALGELLQRGEHLSELMRPDGGNASARVRNRIERLLDVGQGETAAAVDAEILDSGIPQTRWAELASWLRSGGVSDGKLAACLDAANATADIDERRGIYIGLCLTKEFEPRSDRQFVTKKLRDTRPDLYDLLVNERARLVSLIERRRAALAAERSFALLTVADVVWAGYAAEKARRGALDFADLISATRRLLKDRGALWVHFKLDQGIDHVLVDEAQDTSPEQWEIVQLLTAEFTAGEGARDDVRTIFAVGDEKQSIFGFQGAAPEKFGEVRKHYARGHAGAGREFHVEPLNQSFRTADDVLGTVDRVFARPEAYDGLTFEGAGTTHDTARRGAVGEVQVWPLLEPEEKSDEEKPWFLPLDSVSEKSPLIRHAIRIADAVKGWTEGRDALGPCEKISEGQILILVRNRGPLFEAILRELKSRNLKVAGADRLDVGKHIAALDLLALADALLLPKNDLALASVLKSPLFGLDDEDLMRLAPGRKSSLRQALRESPEDAHRRAEETLSKLAASARHQRPFDLYAGLLGGGGGRRAFRARLGGEVDDVLDEFLRLAMTYGESETATLAGFAAWMRAAPAEIKRDLETAGEDVRVMTVHGSKGLEAKLVLLADFGAERHGSLAPCIYIPEEPERREGEAELLLWSVRKKEDPAPLAAAREAEKQREAGEHRRLLYVALTRAEDRLIVAAHKGERTKEEGSWFRLVADALGDDFAESRDVPALGGPLLVYPKGRTAAPLLSLDGAEPKPPPAQPDWLRKPLSREPQEPEPLAPSRALQHEFTGSTEAGSIPALDRGVVLHRLLEELPKIARGERREAAWRYLSRTGAEWPEAAREALAEEALELLEVPEILELLTAPGRSEVPIAGEIARGGGRPPVFVAGRIDRLAVGPDRVLILDFKSDRPVPEAAPDGYVAQLALYRQLLQRIFPGKHVQAALLWTATGRLDRLPEARLDAVLGCVLGIAPVP